MATTRLRALYRPLTELLKTMAVVLVLGVGVWALAHNQITVGGLVVFVTYLSRLYSPIGGLVGCPTPCTRPVPAPNASSTCSANSPTSASPSSRVAGPVAKGVRPKAG